LVSGWQLAGAVEGGGAGEAGGAEEAGPGVVVGAELSVVRWADAEFAGPVVMPIVAQSAWTFMPAATASPPPPLMSDIQAWKSFDSGSLVSPKAALRLAECCTDVLLASFCQVLSALQAATGDTLSTAFAVARVDVVDGFTAFGVACVDVVGAELLADEVAVELQAASAATLRAAKTAPAGRVRPVMPGQMPTGTLCDTL
jgi:hypothetical protein